MRGCAGKLGKASPQRIKEYRPDAIVSLLARIAPIVQSAAQMSASGAKVASVPFPGHGHQKRFLEVMVPIMKTLPKVAPR